jgi:hypothetical protein
MSHIEQSNDPDHAEQRQATSRSTVRSLLRG